nr:MAG TPA: hypothetical protein [Caudoviricetes sp.]
MKHNNNTDNEPHEKDEYWYIKYKGKEIEFESYDAAMEWEEAQRE